MKIIRSVAALATAAVMLVFPNASLLADHAAPEVSNDITAISYSQSFSPDRGIGGFVARLYTIALQRNYDQGGFDNWCNMLASGELDGGNCARGIFFSSEFVGKHYTPSQYLTILYRVFFNREPDTAGFNAWLNVILNGKSYEEVLEDFINSTEWANVCLSFGIRSGGSAQPTLNVSVTPGIRRFVESLYSDVLGRQPDQAGFDSWAGSLARLTISGKEAARGFFYSPEFLRIYDTLSNEQKITIFYTVFLGRQPDAAGLSSWVGALNNGGNIDTLFNGFSDSSEFRAKCLDAGILPVIGNTANISTEQKTYIISDAPNSYIMIRGHFLEDAPAAILADTNSFRSAAGVPALSAGEAENFNAARVRALELVANFSHQRPDGTNFSALFSQPRSRAENIARAVGTRDPHVFSNVWRNSGMHYQNMISSTYTNMDSAVFVPESGNYVFAVQCFYG